MITYDFTSHRLVTNGGEYSLNRKIGESWTKTEKFSSLSHLASKLLAERLIQEPTDPLQDNINKVLEAILIKDRLGGLKSRREKLLGRECQ